MTLRFQCLPLALTLCLLLAGCGGAASRDAPEEAPVSTDEPSVSTADTLPLPVTNLYEIRTPEGRMVVRLYDETPRHRDNFKKLVAEQFYDSTTFHRVIEGFMIQGGDPNSRGDDPDAVGQGGPGYTIPAEFRPDLYHKRGALAAARQGDPVNPERRSSGSQFYIVQGEAYDDSTLAEMEQALRQRIPDADFSFSDSARAAYTSGGGVPFLDQQYTVFGEVVEGFDVLDRIAATRTPRRAGEPAPPALADRPQEPIPMTIRPVPEEEEEGPTGNGT